MFINKLETYFLIYLQLLWKSVSPCGAVSPLGLPVTSGQLHQHRPGEAVPPQQCGVIFVTNGINPFLVQKSISAQPTCHCRCQESHFGRWIVGIFFHRICKFGHILCPNLKPSNLKVNSMDSRVEIVSETHFWIDRFQIRDFFKFDEITIEFAENSVIETGPWSDLRRDFKYLCHINME